MNQAKARKVVMRKKLKSMGYDLSNMSFSRQQKLLTKVLLRGNEKKGDDNDNNEHEEKDSDMKDLSKRADEEGEGDDKQKSEFWKKFESTDNIRALEKIAQEKEAALKKHSKPKQTKPKPTPTPKPKKPTEMKLDLDFNDILKTDLKDQWKEEVAIRRGRSEVSNMFYFAKYAQKGMQCYFKPLRQRVKELQKKQRELQWQLGKKKGGAEQLQTSSSEVLLQRLAGEKVEDNLYVLQRRLKKKQYEKRRSKRRWKAIEAKKSFGFNKKQERRTMNIQKRIHSVKERRTGKLLPTEKLVELADV
ncbi:hypothetical protein RFI_24857 [Reticulomyxa filosa]|uniref:Uncharacterized protein n=1 Tax=Reticulomyxa filosa TaxID=46433 RepID=X6MER8_RETFI|nr:hypothetical protein RFI_24857 [Reticulomyxa filosa]|eukprot:ETO12518.1 hypothetical protein RFI_24857 [Reticulomyxa filosa]